MTADAIRLFVEHSLTEILANSCTLDEPPHVHVGKGNREAKFWLKPVALARVGRLKPVDLQEIKRIIEDNRDFLLRAWEKEQSKRGNR